MSHYVCKECSNESSQAGVCQTEDCLREGLPLAECNCEDGKHEEVLAHQKSSGESEDNKEESSRPGQTLDLDNE